MEIMTKDAYNEAFGLVNKKPSLVKGDGIDKGSVPGKDSAADKLKEALKYANDNRKLEIDLYWKRATYFWTLIAVAFAGYFTLLGTEKRGGVEEQHFLAFAISCIGFVFTCAWFCVNLGSKRWQENWEIHVDNLEDDVTGPLYKTIMKQGDSDNKCKNRKSIFSVSKINKLINIFTMLIWGILCFYASDMYLGLCKISIISVEKILIFFVALLFSVLIFICGRTQAGDYQYTARKREPKNVGGTCDRTKKSGP